MSITKDNYLDKLFIDESKPALNRHAGGSSGPTVPTTPTDNRTRMAYWYQYLNSDGRFDDEVDWDQTQQDDWGYYSGVYFLPTTPIESLEHPSGTQNITDFSNYGKIYIHSYEVSYDMYSIQPYVVESSVPVKNMTGELDMSGATSAYRMFEGMVRLENVGILKNTSRIENFGRMFYLCTSLTTIPELDTSNGTNFENMFGSIRSPFTIPELDTSNGTNFERMFMWSTSLTTIPELDTSNGTNFESMFQYCSSLTTIPELDTSTGTNFRYMFYGCEKLKHIGNIDVSKWNETSAYYCSSIFSSCKELEHVGITGVISSSGLDLSASTKLDRESLVAFLNALVSKTSGTWTITIGSTNKAKLTDDELYIATSKGWQVK